MKDGTCKMAFPYVYELGSSYWFDPKSPKLHDSVMEAIYSICHADDFDVEFRVIETEPDCFLGLTMEFLVADVSFKHEINKNIFKDWITQVGKILKDYHHEKPWVDEFMREAKSNGQA